MNIACFKTIFNELYLPLCMYALRLLNNKEDAEDCVQQCFSSLYESIDMRKEITGLKPYLYRAVRNIAVSKIRSRAHESDTVSIDESEDVEDEIIDTSERDARLWEEIGKLPEKCRIVFLMSKRDGLSNNEIAEELGISVKTVENQMTKAFKKLRESLMPAGR